MIVRTGRSATFALSRVPQRRALGAACSSSPLSCQPKFVAGSSSQLCTLEVMAPVGPNENVPSDVEMGDVADAKAAVSPPGVTHDVPGQTRCVHVASPAVACAPLPPGRRESDVPSPHAAMARHRETSTGLPFVLVTTMSSRAETIVEPAGTTADTSNFTKERRMNVRVLRPV